MATSCLTNAAPSSPVRQSGRLSTHEFHLLGLRPREARLEVIREALKETAVDVRSTEQWAPEDGERLARLAVAGYRLLDPRRRRTLFERVQLLLWTEEDLVPPAVRLWDLATNDFASTTSASSGNARLNDASASVAVSGRVTATPTGSASAPPVTARQVRLVHQAATETEETQAALEVFRTLRSRQRRATALWIGIAAIVLGLICTGSLIAALV